MGKEGHREGQQRQHDQRPEAADAGIDRQEQGAGADGGAVEAEHPRGVVLGPASGNGSV
ncbi:MULTISPECIES: hypothetical protein [Pseudomonas]|uniref:hypothetical protein n=1 Tax=Pseudomonas TaxID=286 RepID=UPI00273AA159|nr:hypothetical protein [Pseudomonas sp. GV047]